MEGDPLRIEHIYAWICTDEKGRESIPAQGATYSHPMMSTLSRVVTHNQMVKAAKRIAEMTGKSVRLVRWNCKYETLVTVEPPNAEKEQTQ